jgi:hypothetical protein
MLEIEAGGFYQPFTLLAHANLGSTFWLPSQSWCWSQAEACLRKSRGG